MTTQGSVKDGSAWRSGWTAAEPAAIGYAWAPNEGGGYVERDGLLCRDLGLGETCGGAVGARRVRVGDPETASRWRSPALDFDFLFVIAGSVTVENARGEAVELGLRGAAIHAEGLSYRLRDFSEDFEAVQLTSPARFEAGPDTPRDEADAVPRYTHDTEDEYERGAGPRRYFLYRDLGTRGPTEGRIHLHVVRATEPGAGTGWHYHSMSQWYMVIGGTGVVRIEDHPRQPLSWGDSMAVGRGPRMRHNVTGYSGDYLVLEMCVPADYETIAVEEPDGADRP